MIKLKVLNIDKCNYVLEGNNKVYNLALEFLGDRIPTINDIIYLSTKIIKEKNIYTFGPINGKYSKKNNITEDELIKVITPNEEYYLQRYYG